MAAVTRSTRTGRSSSAHTAAPMTTRLTVHRVGPDGTKPLGSTATTVPRKSAPRRNATASGRRVALVTAGVVDSIASSTRAPRRGKPSVHPTPASEVPISTYGV
jgi:hypothetical protein